MYRGSQYPVLVGHYLFSDYCSGHMWSLSPDGGGGFDWNDLGDLLLNFTTSSFGEGVDGELYVATLAGTIYHVVENTPPLPVSCAASPASPCAAPVQSTRR